MKHSISIFIIISFSIFFSIKASSQKYSTNSKVAINLYEQAKTYYNWGDYAKTKNSLLKAILADENFIEAHIFLADVYCDIEDYTSAIKHYKKAIGIKSNLFPIVFYSVAKAELKIGLYEEAKIHLDSLFKYNISETIRKNAEDKYERALFGIKAMKNPVPFNPVNLGPAINSQYNEYFPCLTADEQTLLFTRLIPEKNSIYSVQEDFYMSIKRGDNWDKAYNIGYPINTIYNEGAPTLSPDGITLIFTACETNYGYGEGRKGYGRCDIFFSQKVGDTWTIPINIGQHLNSSAWESQPSISSDGETIYFLSNRPGGYGLQDIWVSTLGDDGYWTNPRNLGKTINTSEKEESVFIHPDNQTLYFSSEGHIGMGGTDIFVSRRDEQGNWTEPINLGYPINTWNNENSIFVSASGEIAYYASDRSGSYGKLDLYSFELYELVRPLKVTYVKGKLFDSQTNKPIYGKFELIDLETGKTVVKSYSNKGNGEFLVCLPVNRNYALNVARDGYIFYSENFSLKDKKSTEPFFLDVPLNPIKDSMTTILRNIFFETGSYELKQESVIELKKLLDFLQKNPSLKVVISGHTDNVGDERANQILSENRAKVVVDYLIKNNIDESRLKYAGYGESKPIATNDTEDGRAQNRRTEFMIIEH